MNDLESLSLRLGTAFAKGPAVKDTWSEPEGMTRVLAQVRKRHDGPGIEADKRTVGMAVAYFRRNGKPEDWRGLKHSCFGAGSPDDRGWCLLSDEPLREKLFGLVNAEAEARRKTKCFQSLLICYWSFPLATANEAARSGWLGLRSWLVKTLPVVARAQTRTSGWMQAISDHSNLLRENPCDRYGPNLLKGDATDFRHALESLAIPSDSWVLDEAVLSQMRAGVDLGHDSFKQALPGLLSVAMGKAGVNVSKTLQTRCVAMLVSRYARCPNRHEDIALRDAAVNVIGNPWLRRASWDSSVVDSKGAPDAQAREMVYGWLKQRLITDFFELLSADGTGDTRRLDYWLRFEPFIEDMWFALGGDARWKRGESFDDFKNRAKGRLLNLENTTGDNNAFIMRMGDFVAIEFGATGNALYVYRWEELPKWVLQKLLSGKERTDVAIHELKSKTPSGIKKSHIDSPAAMESWEQKFDVDICRLIGQRPKRRPAFVPDLESLLKSHEVDGEDKRPIGGALWVNADDSHTVFNSRMRKMGFAYRAGRGWSRE